jgi:hypothetical protein
MANSKPKQAAKTIVYASVGVLGAAVVLGILFPKYRKVITAIVIASPIPPIP